MRTSNNESRVGMAHCVVPRKLSGQRGVQPSAALFPVPSERRFSPDARPSDGFGEPATEIFTDLAGGAQTCPAGTPARVVLPGRFGEASHLPVSEGQRSGFARLGCDLWRLVVPRMPH